MTITSPLEVSVSNQGAFSVSRVSDRSALIVWHFWLVIARSAEDSEITSTTRNPNVIWEEAMSPECYAGMRVVFGEKYKTIMQQV